MVIPVALVNCSTLLAIGLIQRRCLHLSTKREQNTEASGNLNHLKMIN